MNLKLVNFQGKDAGQATVPVGILVETVNQHLIWEVVKAEQANKRQGTHKTKTKSEVSGGGQKPWRQKGTGRARQGSTRNPQWRHGGVAFGPVPRDYREAIPRKKKQVAYQHILTAKIQDNKVVVLDSIDLSSTSTKQAFQGLASVVQASSFAEAYNQGRKVKVNSNRSRRRVTLVVDASDEVQRKSIRNLPWVQTVHIDRLAANALYLNHGIIITKSALEKLGQRYTKVG